MNPSETDRRRRRAGRRDLVYKFINCVGMYPVGSIVELSDGRVGIVWSSNDSQALKPEVYY